YHILCRRMRQPAHPHIAASVRRIMGIFSVFRSDKASETNTVSSIELATLEKLKSDQELVGVWSEYAGVGLWDAILVNEDAMHPESQWTWSGEFSRLVGFND